MDYETALAKAKELVEAAKDIVIVTHGRPTMDSIGGSLALMLGIESLGKKAVVICPDPMTVDLSNFVGVDKVTSQFGKKNFVISLDYVDGSIEKVSYNIEGNKFNLVVEHRPGYEPLSQDKAHYSYQGVSVDLIITVDSLHLGQLGKVYGDQKDMFATKSIINIDCHNENSNYGAINLVDPAASSSTELVAEFMATLGVKLTTDIATNLLNAIYAATANFQNPNVTSMAFEVASVCLKAQAKRFGVDQPATFTQAPQPQFQGSPQPVVQSMSAPVQATQSFTKPQTTIPQTQPVQNKPVTQPQQPQQRPQAPQPQQTQQPQQQPQPQKQPPSEWLKPKIYKSSNPGQIS
jgi:nanoRNase/pAp phosphatase (c-di-AMP/oligoRNAs hydrolase)